MHDTRSGDAQRKTVVVVEDNADIRDLLTVVLEDAGYRVVPLADGLNVGEVVRAVQPSAVTLDLALPHMDGLRVLAGLKQDPVTREVPVIVISAYTNRLPVHAKNDVASVISKPFDVAEVVGAVERLAGCPEDPPSA